MNFGGLGQKEEYTFFQSEVISHTRCLFCFFQAIWIQQAEQTRQGRRLKAWTVAASTVGRAAGRFGCSLVSKDFAPFFIFSSFCPFSGRWGEGFTGRWLSGSSSWGGWRVRGRGPAGSRGSENVIYWAFYTERQIRHTCTVEGKNDPSKLFSLNI